MSTQNQSANENHGPFAIGALAICGVAVWESKQERILWAIENFYFQNFEKIYLGLYAFTSLLVAFFFYKLRQKTKEHRIKAKILRPFWKPKEEAIYVGQTEAPDKVPLFLDDNARCGHVQVIGSTGRGKSKNIISPWCVRDLRRGNSSLIIDGKGGQELYQSVIREFKKEIYLDELLVFFLDLDDLAKSTACINPLRNGTSAQITDRIFSSFEFDESYYKAVQYDACLLAVEVLESLAVEINFKELYGLLKSDEKFMAMALKLEDELLRKRVKSYLQKSEKERAKNLAGLVSQMAPFSVGELACLVNGVQEDESEKVFFDTEAFFVHELQQYLFVASISALKYQQSARVLGKLIMQDLAWCVGEREHLGKSQFTSVFLDEFAEFVYEGFTSILSKARSARVALHLCHQGSSDLSVVSEDFLRSVNTNTNVKCILGLNDPETADFFARHIGTKQDEKLTEQVEEKGAWLLKSRKEMGRGSLREVESYKIHPNRLKEFIHGKGVLHFPSPRGLVSEVVDFSPTQMSLEEMSA